MTFDQDLSTKALSCHYWDTTFADEMRAAGLGSDATKTAAPTIHDVASVIRAKGQHLTCPRDGHPGAAYVDSVGDANDCVGAATQMLSYTWGYEIRDILSALSRYCTKQKLNPRRTYVWACCVCVNQHRVSLGAPLPFDFFEEKFRERVKRIGHVLALMAPWSKPLYITRVWTCFELYTAVTSDGKVKLDIVMPPSESLDLARCIVQPNGLESVWQALKGLKVEHAEAFSSDDRDNILKLIQNGPGFALLNLTVSNKIRDWMVQTVSHHVEKKLEAYGACIRQSRPKASYYSMQDVEDEGKDNDTWDVIFAHGEALGDLLRRFGMLSRAQEIYEKTKDLAPTQSYETENYAKLLKKEGSSIMALGDPAGALLRYSEALFIYCAIGQGNSKGTGSLLNYIASAREKVGDLLTAVDANEKSKQILLQLGQLQTGNGAYMLREYGEMLLKADDLEGAMLQFEEAMSIYKLKGKLGTPDHAYLLNSEAQVDIEKDDLQGALKRLTSAEQIHRQMGTLGTNGGLHLLFTLGKTRISAGDPAGAQAVLNEAKGLYEANGTLETKGSHILQLLDPVAEDRRSLYSQSTYCSVLGSPMKPPNSGDWNEAQEFLSSGVPGPQEGPLGVRPLVYRGFVEHAYRLMFPYEDHYHHKAPQLYTILPSGVVENSKRLDPKKEKGIICYALSQSMPETNAQMLLHEQEEVAAPFVWKRDDDTFALVQTWSSDYNAQFLREFRVSETNPDEAKFSTLAAQEFQHTVQHLFGEETAQPRILYCHRQSTNDKKVYVGTSKVLFAFLHANPAVVKEMSILAIFKAGIVVGTVDGRGRHGLKDFGMATDEKYALYTKLGWVTMACLTPLSQFMRERELLEKDEDLWC